MNNDATKTTRTDSTKPNESNKPKTEDSNVVGKPGQYKKPVKPTSSTFTTN